MIKDGIQSTIFKDTRTLFIQAVIKAMATRGRLTFTATTT